MSVSCETCESSLALRCLSPFPSLLGWEGKGSDGKGREGEKGVREENSSGLIYGKKVRW